MTHARTIAALAAAALAVTLAPQVYGVTALGHYGHEHHHDVVQHVGFDEIEPLAEVVVEDIIDGVRVVAEDEARIESVRRAVEKFDTAGWPLTNTEVRFDVDACDGPVRAFHAFEHGHHVVVMCAETELTLLHELAHVWSDLYLDEAQRAEWVELRGLESWHEGEWRDRGTEHAAEIIAFGLYDTPHVPRAIGNNDYRTVTEAFEWLMGMPPVHRQRAEEATTGIATSTRVSVVASRTIEPGEADSVAAPTTDVTDEHVAPAEYRFPIACGFPRWHSAHGGYGYVDPRDWVHVGVDLYAFEGTPVVSPVHGTVVDAGWHDIAGWKVVVEDRFGYVHRMVHLAAPPLATEGMTVTAGQRLGEVGRSGNAAGGGPHLHYEIRIGDATIDPMPWLDRTGDGHVAPAPRSLHTAAAPLAASCSARA